MLLGSIIWWSCSSTKNLHVGQEPSWLCHFNEKYSKGSETAGRVVLLFFPSPSQNTSVPPTSSKFCLFSKGKHECCLENTSQFSREKSALSRQVLGAEKGVVKVPSLSAEQISALIRLLDNNKINRGCFFLSCITRKLKKIQKFPFFWLFSNCSSI